MDGKILAEMDQSLASLWDGLKATYFADKLSVQHNLIVSYQNIDILRTKNELLANIAMLGLITLLQRITEWEVQEALEKE